jgi:flavin-dependent thymidylate synthase
MEVRLAGHNLDRDLLLEIRAAVEAAAKIPPGISEESDAARARAIDILRKDNWTPETLSAAYARISRDPRPVTELRAIARDEVDAARRSNRRIIFGLGHASVAEHAVFNLDIVGVSRLVTEEIERMRLCSYTEKSQRYILLDEDFVVPAEVREAGLEDDFRSLLRKQNEFYRRAYERLEPWVFSQNPELAAKKTTHRMLEGLAKEDARYGLSLATTVQLGETINARNLESLIARTRAHPLAELREFSDRVHAVVSEIAPSVIRYTEPSDSLLRTSPLLRREVGSEAIDSSRSPVDEVVLLDLADDAEIRVVAALLHSFGRADAQTCRRHAASLGPRGREKFVRAAMQHLGPHDSILREFEHLSLHYELVVSAACFGQLKRHRMATLTVQDYDTRLGVTTPPSFEATGLVKEFERVRKDSESLYATIWERAGAHVAPYVLLNAHRRRLLWTLNLRELYHVSRLRLDAHAQWDIRRLADRLTETAREQIPLLLLLACGKDRFEQVRDAAFSEDGESVAEE